MMRWTVALSLALLTSCEQPTSKLGPAAPAPLSSFDRTAEAPASDKNMQSVGRYQMLRAGEKTLKLDTITGKTWLLEESKWKILQAEAGLADAQTLKRIRMVVELALQSVMPTASYNEKTQRVEPITAADKKQQIEKVVQQALNAYDDLKENGAPRIGDTFMGSKVTKVTKVE